MGNISKNLINLANKAKEQNEKIYIVGGYIRNNMLHANKTDIDLSGTLNPTEIAKVAGECGFASQIVNEKFGTVLLTLSGEQYEYTPFRKDIYLEGGFHTPEKVEFVKKLEVDVTRRDFTVNAMYYDIAEDKFIDIYNGKKDIKHKLLKCIMAPRFVFASDGLRILRLIRFACELDLRIEKETFKSAKKFAYQLKDISKERIVRELKQIVVSDTKNDFDEFAHVRAIKLINSLGLWKYIFNSDFAKFKVKTHGDVFNMYKKCKPENRFDALMCVVFYNMINTFKVSDKLVEFYLNLILGTEGLKLQKSINNIKSLIDILRSITIDFKENVYDFNNLCIKYSNLNEDNKNIISSGFDIVEIENNIETMLESKVPFKPSDLSITSEELIALGISNKSLKKVFAVIVFELVSMKLKNDKQEIINYVKEKFLKNNEK